MEFSSSASYRKDIDGLRALAVVSVILFHYGALPRGYLGVDVFFVISGFLITGNIHREAVEERFSMVGFYLRRVRRILPLTLLVVGVSLLIGVFVMLPDDLENLAQSVIATNFCANNILQIVTTKNYWDVVNEFKPLMHTWSLGVEEQYYLLYPFIVAPLCRRHTKVLLGSLVALAALSIALCLLPSVPDYQKFYLIFFRFWELAAGGVAALFLQGRRLLLGGMRTVLLGGLLCFLGFDLSPIPDGVMLFLTVLATTGLLASECRSRGVTAAILENPVSRYIGLISFSLYMWHQVVLAFARYFWVDEMSSSVLGMLSLIIVALSVGSYLWVEKPFRNRRVVSTPVLLASLGGVFAVTTGVSFHLYREGGVIRDVPELGIRKEAAEKGIHAAYNARAYKFEKQFTADGRTKVLVIGDSFARDWLNVLLESSSGGRLDIAYAKGISGSDSFFERVGQADVVFYTRAGAMFSHELAALEDWREKLWIVGTKNFGVSNGIFYNRKGSGYFAQRTVMQQGVAEANERMKDLFGNRYLDYLGKVMDGDGKVPVFTPDRQFISQDCRHFTEAGARYFAAIFDADLRAILPPGKSGS